MIELTNEEFKELIEQAHMTGQNCANGCDPSASDASVHWASVAPDIIEREREVGDTIVHNTAHVFGFKDRIRILFGKELSVHSEIRTLHVEALIAPGKMICTAHVARIFPRRKRGYEGMAPPLCKCPKTEQEQCDDAMKGVVEQERIIHGHNSTLIKELAYSRGMLRFQNDYFALLEDCGVTGKVEIVGKPEGDDQNESSESFSRVFVDQYSVGISGDSFAGHIYAEFDRDKWLKIPYDC